MTLDTTPSPVAKEPVSSSKYLPLYLAVFANSAYGIPRQRVDTKRLVKIFRTVLFLLGIRMGRFGFTDEVVTS
jgi:hypothetical protein